jgi:hypothetical protein
MNDDPDLVVFPDISDEAVIALDQFLEEFYARFQNHYFAQMHRHYAGLPDPPRSLNQLPLPRDDPPF